MTVEITASEALRYAKLRYIKLLQNIENAVGIELDRLGPAYIFADDLQSLVDELKSEANKIKEYSDLVAEENKTR